MNILVTNRCNRRCSYCFAQEQIAFSADESRERGAPEFISEVDFRVAVDFAKRSRVPLVGLLGGEPSLHPHFVDLIGIVRAAGLRTKIFTNGLWSESLMDAVDELAKEVAASRPGADPINLVVNVNGPQRTPAAQQRRQEQLLARLGHLCSLSFNISRSDLDPTFLVELITRYQTRRSIRLGMAQPLADLTNEHIDIADYRDVVPMVMQLSQACDEHDISLGFDCGFLLCMFTAEQLGALVLSGARFAAKCGPAIDVGTDLSTWSCFPLSTFSSPVRLTDFENIDAVADHFRRRFRPLFSAGALPECRTCRHRLREQCPGGCAAHVHRRLNP